MIREKTKAKILEFHELFLSCFFWFFGISRIKKNIKETAVL